MVQWDIRLHHVRAVHAKQNFAALLDDAQRGPVVIRRRSRDQAVVISPQEYARLRGLAVADFQEFCDRVGREAVERGLASCRMGHRDEHAPGVSRPAQ